MQSKVARHAQRPHSRHYHARPPVGHYRASPTGRSQQSRRSQQFRRSQQRALPQRASPHDRVSHHEVPRPDRVSHRDRPPYPAGTQRPSSRRRRSCRSTAKPAVLARRTLVSTVLAAVVEVLFWLIGAMVLRVLIDGIMAMSSQFWLLGVVVACLPAITALWITHLSPQKGFVVGYRCLMVMAGLLLGGRIGGF